MTTPVVEMTPTEYWNHWRPFLLALCALGLAPLCILLWLILRRLDTIIAILQQR